MRGRSCQENLLDVSCMVIYNESILYSAPQEGREEAENVPEDISQQVPQVVPQANTQVAAAESATPPQSIATPRSVGTPQPLPSVQSYRSETGVSYHTVETLPLHSKPSQTSFFPIQPIGENIVIPEESGPEMVAVPVVLAESTRPPVPELP